jgi:hypothetical protein
MYDCLLLVFYMRQHLMMALNYPKHVVIYVYNKARWSTVANEDCLYLLICKVRIGLIIHAYFLFSIQFVCEVPRT